MRSHVDPLEIARWQFGITTVYHFLMVPLTIGLGPVIALMQWQSEIKDYTNGKLKVLIYHISANPKCKFMKAKDLKQYDVIMVSYSSLESMHRKEQKGWSRDGGLVKEDSVLHSIKFHRLILDEAHSIKSRTTGVAKACFALTAAYAAALPLQGAPGATCQISFTMGAQTLVLACRALKRIQKVVHVVARHTALSD